MGRQSIPQPCYAAGVEGAVVIETAEHESHGREEAEIGKCRKKSSLTAAVAAAAIQDKFGPCCGSAPTG